MKPSVLGGDPRFCEGHLLRDQVPGLRLPGPMALRAAPEEVHDPYLAEEEVGLREGLGPP